MKKIHVSLKEYENIFFSSDQHFGHRNVLRFCNRPFENTKEMEIALIKKWNETVTNKDVVFTLGDFCWFNDSRQIKKILNQLNGKKIYIILGNHDTLESFHRVDDPRIEIIEDIAHVYVHEPDQPDREIILCHYPLMTWAHRDKGAINLFGHIHSGPGCQNTFDQDLPLYAGQQYDVGCDNNNYTPISLEEVDEKLRMGDIFARIGM